MNGRTTIFQQLKSSINPDDKVIWMHVASLGEFEQGLPILETLKSNYPNYKIVLTFFSPSGYEVKKKSEVAHVIVYLPMDTHNNAKKFLDIVQPTISIFVKYEIWPNYLHHLKKRAIPTFLVSSIFQQRQVFFKWYGSFMRNALNAFTYFFVQNENSSQLLQSIGHSNVAISGDTRFDRVIKILDDTLSLDFMEAFKGDNVCLVAGSTWPEDEAVLLDFINESKDNVKYVIAPHNIKHKHIQNLKAGIKKKAVLFSEYKEQPIESSEVLIVDTIGLLTKIYSYADIAYVGGGFATGLHNTLEPAVFGVPVLIGPHYTGFQEVEDLTRLKGILTVTNSTEFKAYVNLFVKDIEERKAIGKINSDYIDKNRGATTKIIAHLEAFL